MWLSNITCIYVWTLNLSYIILVQDIIPLKFCMGSRSRAISTELSWQIANNGHLLARRKALGRQLGTAFHSKSINRKIARNKPPKTCLNKRSATVKSTIVVCKDATYRLRIGCSSNAREDGAQTKQQNSDVASMAVGKVRSVRKGSSTRLGLGCIRDAKGSERWRALD